MRPIIGTLVLALALTGCGTFNVQVQTLPVQDATATGIAVILRSRTPPVATLGTSTSPISQNLSPGNVPVSVSCQMDFYWGKSAGLCPDAAPIQVDAAFQVYDKGYMLWENATGSVYVLYNGGQGRKYDPDTISMWPEVSLVTPPPSNHVPPLRGFGRVWQHEVDVQSGLGWPLGLEQAYTAQYQTSGIQTPISYFYISLPNGQVIEFLNAGVWRIVR